MKTEDLKAKGFTDEQIAFIMAARTSSVKRTKRIATKPSSTPQKRA